MRPLVRAHAWSGFLFIYFTGSDMLLRMVLTAATICVRYLITVLVASCLSCYKFICGATCKKVTKCNTLETRWQYIVDTYYL